MVEANGHHKSGAKYNGEFMKKNVLVHFIFADKKWMGGIYYIKNILFQLSISVQAKEKYNLYLCTNDSVMDEFQDLAEEMNITVIEYDHTLEQILKICSAYNIHVVLPITGGEYTWLLKDICLYWIPDFQDVFLPENFEREEVEYRKQLRKYIAHEHRGLILSSKDSYSHYKMLYPDNIQNVFVAHFTSCISTAAEQITDSYTANVMGKYGIEYDYVFVANQFWKHKNHIVVLKAMDKIINEEKKELHLVCTGLLQSYAGKNEYVNELYQYIERHSLSRYIHFLGLLERTEQLCIMENSQMLIQPSKFEGWGCSVEDAKAMGKVILLSDIDVHKEQQYPKSVLFPQDDGEALADIILNQWGKNIKFDLEYGRNYAMEKAIEYSEELQAAIDSIEVNENKNYLSELFRMRSEKINSLFGGLPANQICVYGVGNYAREILKGCKAVLKDTHFIYSDSNEEKWGKDFDEGKIYPPQQLLSMGIKRIVILSPRYQEEIYQQIKGFEKDMEIRKLFCSEKERWEMLWI